MRYGHIKAISQQRCREVLPDVEKHALADAALIGAWFHGIKLAFREAAIDVAITNNTPWLIEWNPPALWGQSGSSLLTETDLLSLMRSPLEPFSIPVFVRSAEPPPRRTWRAPPWGQPWQQQRCGRGKPSCKTGGSGGRKGCKIEGI